MNTNSITRAQKILGETELHATRIVAAIETAREELNTLNNLIASSICSDKKLSEQALRQREELRARIETLRKNRNQAKSTCAYYRRRIAMLGVEAPAETKKADAEELIAKIIELISDAPEGVTLEDIKRKLNISSIKAGVALKEARARGFEYIKRDRRTYYGRRTYLTTSNRLRETLRIKIINLLYAGPLRIAEIAETLNAAPASIKQETEELEHIGALKSAMHASQDAKLYSINKNYQEAC